MNLRTTTMRRSTAVLAALLAMTLVACDGLKNEDDAETSGLGSLLKGGEDSARLVGLLAFQGANNMERGFRGHMSLIQPADDPFRPGTTSETINVDKKEFPCAGGGTLTLSGAQTLTADAVTNAYNKAFTLSNGSRAVTFADCAMNERMTITSGSLTINQIGTAKWRSESAGAATAAGTSVSENISDLNAEIKGTLNIKRASGGRPFPGHGGPPSGEVVLDLRLAAKTREMSSTIGEAGALKDFKLVTRTGTVTGTMVRGGQAREINRVFDGPPGR